MIIDMDKLIFDSVSRIAEESFQKTLEHLEEEKNIPLHRRQSRFRALMFWNRSFDTRLGHFHQNVITEISEGVVINLDSAEKKTSGADLHFTKGDKIYLIQLKSAVNTQTGSHKPDSINKLKRSAKKMGAIPTMAVFYGESDEKEKDGVLYITGESFWDLFGFDCSYNDFIQKVSDARNVEEDKIDEIFRDKNHDNMTR